MLIECILIIFKKYCLFCSKVTYQRHPSPGGPDCCTIRRTAASPRDSSAVLRETWNREKRRQDSSDWDFGPRFKLRFMRMVCNEVPKVGRGMSLPKGATGPVQRSGHLVKLGFCMFFVDRTITEWQGLWWKSSDVINHIRTRGKSKYHSGF